MNVRQQNADKVGEHNFMYATFHGCLLVLLGDNDDGEEEKDGRIIGF